MYLEQLNWVANTQTEKEQQVLDDYRLVCLSRHLSLLGRREVHNGRAHFGIFGEGKELVQVALSHSLQHGDWRSGYYRDQTLMLALGLLKSEEFFSMIYGDPDDKVNPSTGGRNFNNHFTTSNIDRNGRIVRQNHQYNSASDISPTAGQMPRALGLAQASKLIRQRCDWSEDLKSQITGEEVVVATIGDGSTSEGLFFETINAAAVLQVPLVVVVYDDGYGISVPTAYQTAKGSISKALAGFMKEDHTNGIRIYSVKGWDYQSMIDLFKQGIDQCRREQVPVLFHIEELTQPAGHSTSGSHERYKTEERLRWEVRFDALIRFKEWLIKEHHVNSSVLDAIDSEAAREARTARDRAWEHYSKGLLELSRQLEELAEKIKLHSAGIIDHSAEISQISQKTFPTRRALMSLAKRIGFEVHRTACCPELKTEVNDFIARLSGQASSLYNEGVMPIGPGAAIHISAVALEYQSELVEVNGSEVLNRNFDALFERFPNLITFGEDTGRLGDVNQGMKGLQTKYGEERVGDTGIREATIIGQGIGLAMRGFRPIAEIQYLDYLIYGLSQLSDDLASLNYRTKGRQIAPLIVRTRGHQLQGIWHAGSPMMLLLGALRGMYLCVPRDMTRAAGFYNTLLRGNEPALVIEPLKGYYVKERCPENPGDYCTPLGVPEVVEQGEDLTLVTYGWNVNHAIKAAHLLREYQISVEVIDVQTLLPFDLQHRIGDSVRKTGKVLFLDEDVPGGATAYMLQQVLEHQHIFDYLETAPRTLAAGEHRPAYGIDGEYFSKPNVEQIFETVWEMMHETDVEQYRRLYRD